jgi:hypothetical protein
MCWILEFIACIFLHFVVAAHLQARFLTYWSIVLLEGFIYLVILLVVLFKDDAFEAVYCSPSPSETSSRDKLLFYIEMCRFLNK